MPQNFIKKFTLSTTIGTGIGMISSSVLIFLMAAALTVGDVPAMLISPITVIFLAFGGFCGGVASAKLCGEKGIFCGILSGTLFFVVAWIFGGQASVISRIIYALVGLAGAWCITLLFRKNRDSINAE